MICLMVRMMNKQYIKLILSIFINNEAIADKILKEVYNAQKLSLNELLQYISKLYIDYANEGVLDITTMQKKKIKKDINKYTSSIFKKLGVLEIEITTKILEEAYKNTYYKTAYVLKSGLKKADKLKLVRREHINAVINTEFKDEMYSDRIWNNKRKMIKSLKKQLNEAMKGKGNIDTIATKLKKEFNVQAYKSRRLVRTEMARVQSTANEDIAKAQGIEKQLFDATLDNKTSNKCRGLDGTEWNIDDKNKPITPLHPHCRSCLINIISGWKPSKKWDNENKETIDYKNYIEWLKENGVT